MERDYNNYNFNPNSNYANNLDEDYYNLRVQNNSFNHGLNQIYYPRPPYGGGGHWGPGPYQYPAWAYRPMFFPGGILPWLVLGSIFWPRDGINEYYEY